MPISATKEKSMRQMSSASNAPTPADGKRRKNRDRMNVTFVQNAEHDINHHNGRQDQQWLAR